MRVLMVLLALAATPFVAGVSQAPPGGDLNCVQSGSFQTADGLVCAGVVTLGEVHGTVFQDVLGTGIRVPGDPGVPNWVVTLNGVQTLTDVSGNYAFTGLAAGTYLLCEVQRFGWMETLPPAGSTSCGTASWGYTVILAPGQILTGLDFGNMKLM